MTRRVVEGILFALLITCFLWFTFWPPAWFAAMVRRP